MIFIINKYIYSNINIIISNYKNKEYKSISIILLNFRIFIKIRSFRSLRMFF